MKDKEQFENASQFLGCYFHQDFSFEFADPEVALKQFLEENDAVIRAAVLRELRQVVAECDDQALSEVIFELGCYYSPERHRDITMRAWLDEVIAAIQGSLAT